MIFITTNNNLDETKHLFNKEKEFIEYNINSQKNMKSIILKYMQNLVNYTSSDLNSASNILGVFESLKNSLELCNNNISLLETLLSEFDKTIFAINNNLNVDESVNNFNSKYTSFYTSILQSTLTVEECLQRVEEKNPESKSINLDSHIEQTNFEKNKTTTHPESTSKTESISINLADETKSAETETKKEIKEEIEEQKEQETKTEKNELILPKIPQSHNNIEIEIDNAYIENTLLVSETSGKVVLPYSIYRLERILKENSHKYTSINDIIRKEYTLPISMFKNPFVARFKEAYKLMRNKERASVLDSLELGTELMFNSNLHPAVISACKNLDELDIYLDYLEDDKTNKFNCFDIVFDLPPAVVKNN